MNKSLLSFLICFIIIKCSSAQNFGDFPKIKKERLLNDLDLLYQGLDKFHSGMYWYTPKDSLDNAFKDTKNSISRDLDVLQFHKLIAPLVALSREDHTDIKLPEKINAQIKTETNFFPLVLVFLGKQLYCFRNGSHFEEYALEGKEIESINGETPIDIVDKIGNLFASDGFIKAVKYSDLEGFNFSKYYFYYHGLVDQFELKFKDINEPITIKALNISAMNKNLKKRYKNAPVRDLLEYRILHDSIAYLGIHSFSNSKIKERSKEKNYQSFLKNSFASIEQNNIQTLIIDMSKNSGGTEGNEGILFSYLADNYQKYHKVRAKTQKAVLKNGVDKPITLTTFGFLERVFGNIKMEDGSYERKPSSGYGLMAYKKEPDNKFTGKIYVIISSKTYSGGSEFSNMMYSNNLATFVGQETGGSYLGNTSGYGKELVLPNSRIAIDIPALQFIMNVEPKLPFGRGVIPHYDVVPSFEQYLKKENAPLKYILEELENIR